MFGHLTDLSHNRSHTEALGFYIFFTVFLVGLSSVLGTVLHSLGVGDGSVVTGAAITGVGVNVMIGTLFVVLMSSMILISKKLTSDTLAVILTIIGIYVSYKVDVLLGMIIVTYLTTLKSGK